MNLFDAAVYFDRLTFQDAYSGRALFKGQFDLFDNSKRDGLTNERRTFSCAPGITMPARSAVMVQGRAWIVGSNNPDYFEDQSIRSNFIINQTDGLARVCTMAQAISGTGGFTAFSARNWLKESKEASESASVYPVYELLFAAGEPVAPLQMVKLVDRWHLVRSTYASQAGFMKALSDELPEPVVVTSVWASRRIDPVTEVPTDTTASTGALLMRWQTAYEYLTAASMKFVAGDEIGIVPAALGAVATGDTLTIGGAARRILAVAPFEDILRLHLRR